MTARLRSVHLLAGMLAAVSACLVRSRPAFFDGTVTKPTVRLASLEPAHHLVGAA